ncbi:unnamed protein product [Rhizophagus irregularis]|nr:unnamed protein product [Rhizophagus irregularis]
MLMWEISSGQPPFGDYGNDYYLAKNIVNVDDFNKSNDSEGLSKDFNKLQINSKDEVVQNVYKMDVTQQQVNKHYTDDDDVTI